MPQTFRQIVSGRRFVSSNLPRLFLSFSPEHRFACAVRLAKIIAPFARRFFPDAIPDSALGSYREYLTAATLNSLTIHDVEFDPQLSVEGADSITPGGAIFIGGHFHLNFIFLRWLYDIGRQPSVFLLVSAAEWRILGTKVPLEILNRRAMSLNRVRNLTARGGTVAAVIDATNPDFKWKRLNVGEREVFVVDALIKLAVRTKTPVYFFDTYFDRNDAVAARIVPACATGAEQILEEYAKFISSALNQRKS